MTLLETQRSSIRSDCDIVEAQFQQSSIRSDCDIVEVQFQRSSIRSDCAIVGASDEIHVQYLSGSSGRLGEAARLEQLSLQSFSGGRNNRPLVGGYSADAYEAMKEHYYALRNNKSRTTGI